MTTRRLESYVPIDQTVFTTDYAVGGGVVQKIIENMDCLNNRGAVLRGTTPLDLYPIIPQNCVLITTNAPSAAAFQTVPGEAFHAGRSNILRTTDPDEADLSDLTGWRYGATAADRDINSIGAFSDSGVNLKSLYVLDAPIVVSRKKPNNEPAASISWAAIGITTPFGTPTVATGRDYIVLTPGTPYYLAGMVDSFYECWGGVIGQEVDCTAAGPSLSDQYHLTVRLSYDDVFPNGATGRSGPQGYWGLRLTAKDNADEVYYYESRHCRLHYDPNSTGHPYKDHSVDFLLVRNTRKEGISSVPFPEGLLVRIRNNEFTCLVFRVAQPFVFHTERQVLWAGSREQSLERFVPGADAIRLPPLFNQRAAQVVAPVMHRVTGPKTLGKVADLDVTEKQGKRFFAVTEGQVITTGCLPLANRSSIFYRIQSLVNVIPSRAILENGICQVDSTVTYGVTVNSETDFIVVGGTGLLLADYPANYYTDLQLNNRDFYPLKDAITNLEGLGSTIFEPFAVGTETFSPTFPPFDGTDTPLTVDITVGDVTVDGGSLGQPQYIQFLP